MRRAFSFFRSEGPLTIHGHHSAARNDDRAYAGLMSVLKADGDTPNSVLKALLK